MNCEDEEVRCSDSEDSPPEDSEDELPDW
jgi:hypothetical protein